MKIYAINTISTHSKNTPSEKQSKFNDLNNKISNRATDEIKVSPNLSLIYFG